jgi:uncharacterized protein involved in exopolysaccharide biosynthesis
MTEAQQIVHDLEQRRHHLMLRVVALGEGVSKLAYDAVVHNSFMARQRLRELEDEGDQLHREIDLFDAALVEARRRVEAAGRDADDVMAELGLNANATGASAQ